MIRSSNNNGKVVIDFLIMAFVLFMIIRLMNTMQRKKETTPRLPDAIEPESAPHRDPRHLEQGALMRPAPPRPRPSKLSQGSQ
jgi:hypothetical protein